MKLPRGAPWPKPHHIPRLLAVMCRKLPTPWFDSFSGRGSDNPQVGSLQLPVERGRELRIPVVHDDVGTQTNPLDVLEEGLGVLLNSGLVGMLGRGRDKDAPCLEVQEHKHEGVPKTLDRQDLSWWKPVASPSSLAWQKRN
jgi:hypothetical protein